MVFLDSVAYTYLGSLKKEVSERVVRRLRLNDWQEPVQAIVRRIFNGKLICELMITKGNKQ